MYFLYFLYLLLTVPTSLRNFDPGFTMFLILLAVVLALRYFLYAACTFLAALIPLIALPATLTINPLGVKLAIVPIAFIQDPGFLQLKFLKVEPILRIYKNY